MIKSFKGGCSRTINLGNFESLRVEALVEIEIEVDPGELLSDATWAHVRSEAQVELRRLLEETYKAQHRDAKS